MKTVYPIKIDFAKSHGSFVHDKVSGAEFLDLFSMHSSLALGYNHPVFDSTFFAKVAHLATLRTATNLFVMDELADFMMAFRPHIWSDNVHLTCTGALAVESAIKCAMEKKKVANPMVISLKNSFHGINSWGFITDRVGIVGERMRHFPRNNWLNLSFAEVTEYFCSRDLGSLVAFVLEPIQCTAGDLYVPLEQIRCIRQLCAQHGVCLIVDEIQTGFGATGSMWYSEKIGCEPDILVFGKKAQVCGIVISDKYAEAYLSPVKKLGVTFDGDIIDCVRAAYILKEYGKSGNVPDADRKGGRFRACLESRVSNFRNAGLLIAFDFETGETRDRFVRLCYGKNLLCNSTGDKTVRLRPNMAITDVEIQVAGEIFDSVLTDMER